MTLLFQILILLILLGLIIPAISWAPWVPCKTKDLKRIMKLADLKPGEVFYDLGCGNGKTVLYAAANTPAKKAIGVELSWPMYTVCKIRQLFARLFLPSGKKLEFHFANLYNTDISNADVIYFWGMINTISGKFIEKLKKEARPGTRIISYIFKVKGLTPVQKDKPGAKDSSIYLYIL